MQLPQSKTLTTNRLNGIFNKTVATYKFYWFIGILDLYVKKNMSRMNIWDIMVEMVVNAWYPVCYFHLSFGKSDSLSDAIDSLQRVYDIPINISQAELRKWLHEHKNDTEVRATLRFLPLNVPYRFLRPWIDTSDDRDTMKRSQSFENGCLYRLVKEDDSLWVELNSVWLPYLKENYVILKDFAYWNLSVFLQVRNPHVPNIVNKLIKVETRQTLTKQHNYWDFVFRFDNNIRCIYTNKALGIGQYDLDHFIPWRFVSHDLIWNLIPADQSINSSKSDKIPDLNTYLPRLATLQQKAIKICLSEHFRINDVLDDYSSMGCTPQEIAQMDKSSLLDCFARTFNPMSQIAQNMGFELWRN